MNPVPIGSAFTIADLGQLTVVRSSWAPRQTGLTSVELLFKCERAVGQQCKTSRLLLNAMGSSGRGYERTFDPAVEDPPFGFDLDSALYSGGTESGNAGFLIENREDSLMMLVQIFLQDGKFFFWIGPVAPRGAGQLPPGN